MKLLLSAGSLLLSCFASFCLSASAAGVESSRTPVPPGATVPPWPKPAAQALSPKAGSARSQNLEVTHSPTTPGAFDVRVAAESMALGQSATMIGYVANGDMSWFSLANAAGTKHTLKVLGKSVDVRLEGRDADGAVWKIQQQFSPGLISGAINITTEVTVDQDRSVAFLPLLMVFPGAGTFGAVKGQGLFAGLEYLDDEPSSSEADVIGPASKRQVPDSIKITFPLMAVQQKGHSLALTWETQPDVSEVMSLLLNGH